MKKKCCPQKIYLFWCPVFQNVFSTCENATFDMSSSKFIQILSVEGGIQGKRIHMICKYLRCFLGTVMFEN